MKRRRSPYARRWTMYVVAVLAIVVVIGFGAAGYEINHLRTQTNGLQEQVTSLGATVSRMYSLILTLAAKLGLQP